MDEEISKQTQKILSRQGMKFKLNTKVTSGDASGSGVKLDIEAAKGGKQEAVGSRPSRPESARLQPPAD